MMEVNILKFVNFFQGFFDCFFMGYVLGAGIAHIIEGKLLPAIFCGLLLLLLISQKITIFQQNKLIKEYENNKEKI